jgi:ferrous iron transport protein A
MMRLSEAPDDRPVRVVEIRGGQHARSRLAALGLTVGSEVRCLIKHDKGPVLVQVRQTRLALGRGIADRIMVSDNHG